MRRQRDRHRGIEVRARHACRDITTHRDGEAPGDVDGKIATGRLLAQHHLRDHADAENDQHERAKKFRHQLAGQLSGHARYCRLVRLKPDATRRYTESMPYILALDQGTTSSRAIVFDHDGGIRAAAQKEFAPDLSAAPDGSNTIRRRSGRRSSASRSKRSAAPSFDRTTSRQSASPTSARRRLSGIARPASRSTTPSSGRTGAPPISASA